MGTQNFFFVLHSWQHKNISLLFNQEAAVEKKENS